MNSKINSILVLIGLSFAQVFADPIADCRTIHHTDVDSAKYSEFNCSLNCVIHGKDWPHNMAEGKACPGSSNPSLICQSGKCVSTENIGFIDVEITTAEVPHKTNAYAEVCIKNGTETQTVPLRDRTTCGVCETQVINDSAHPVWNKICSGTSTKKWVENSTVTLQVWDRISETMHNFIGGVSVNITTLLKSDNNHKEMRMKLEKGSIDEAYLFARITWTKG